MKSYNYYVIFTLALPQLTSRQLLLPTTKTQKEALATEREQVKKLMSLLTQLMQRESQLSLKSEAIIRLTCLLGLCMIMCAATCQRPAAQWSYSSTLEPCSERSFTTKTQQCVTKHIKVCKNMCLCTFFSPDSPRITLELKILWSV